MNISNVYELKVQSFAQYHNLPMDQARERVRSIEIQNEIRVRVLENLWKTKKILQKQIYDEELLKSLYKILDAQAQVLIQSLYAL
jgi:hypothetical protein